VTLSRPEIVRFLRFLALGGLAAAVNWASRFAWSLIAPFEVAVLLAYATGMVVAFVLFRLFVFPGSPIPLPVQVRNFVLVNIVGAALTYLTALALVRLVFPLVGFSFHPEAIGHAIAIAVPVATSWVGHRRFTFGTVQE
jgi:putative flippase GtrA